MLNTNPIYIIGNPRSGTSLLRLMLTSHPNINIPPECHFFLWLEDKYKNWTNQDPTDLLLKDIFQSRKFETWGLNLEEMGEYLLSKKAKTYSEVVTGVYQFYGIKAGKEEIKIWGDKNKLWKEKLRTILHYFPESKFIHLVRDGRDVACSFKELANRNLKSIYAPKLPSEIGEIAERWKLNVNFITEFISELDERNVKVIRYEDLIFSTKATLVDISDFLKIEFDDSMLNYSVKSKTSVYEPVEFLKWKEKLNEAPDRDNVGRYKKFLTKDEVSRFESVCYNELLRFSYL